MTARLVTEPGYVRDVALSDVLALVPGGQAATVGLPPGCEFTHTQRVLEGTTISVGEILVTPTRRLPEGKIYLMKPADVIAQLVGDGVPDPTGVVAWRVARTAAALAAELLGRLNFVPLVYQAGDVNRGATMPRPAHCRITWSGVFGSPAAPTEIWSFGMTFLDLPAHGGTTQELADRAHNGYISQGVQTLVTPDVVLTNTRVAFVGDGSHVNKNPDGSYDQADNKVTTSGTATGGGGGAGTFPLQTALAISFYSARPGSTGRGRLFLPLQGVQLGGDYLVPTQFATDCAIRFKDLANYMEDPAGPHVGQHAVMSTKGYSSPVTQYKVGRVPDTMRSRRNALKEAYVVQAP